MMELWENDNVQFARLIAECNAEGIFTKGAIERLCSTMDLRESDINKIIERATEKFDSIKSDL